MLLVAGSGFALAVVAPFIHRKWPRASGWLLSLLPFGLAIVLAKQAALAGEGVLREVYPWIPSLGISLSFRLDGLSLLFALLIAVVGGMVVIYSSGYLAGHDHLGRIYAFLLMFMASMLGLVLADNLLALFVFWELTSLSSYLLIGFYHEREAARSAALQALLVTGLGGLALLAGFVLLGHAGGTFELSALAAKSGELRAHPLYLPMLLLVLLGAFTKSAQFPFHFWLPDAMEAPAPVSAYLHAAAMVKAGVYLVARTSPLLGGTEAWTYLVGGTGGLTMLLGAYLAFRQSYLKRILAYSTVSALGTLMMLLGLGTPAAVKAALVFFLAHVLYKGALFLAAGNVEHGAGTGDVAKLGGLGRRMPATALAVVVAAVVMAGLPPSFGFVAKESLLEAALASPFGGEWLAALTVAASVLIIAVSGLVSLRPFFGAATEASLEAHEGPPALLLGPVVLGVSGFLLGLLPGAERLLAPAVEAVLGVPTPINLALWHGWNFPLALSAVSLVAGALLYSGRDRTVAILTATDWGRFGPAGWYRTALKGMLRIADFQTRLLQSGYLRSYLLTILGVTVGLLAFTALRHFEWPAPPLWDGVRLHELLVVLLILASVVAAVLSPSRLSAIAALGVAGYGIGLIFLLEGAPDLAITQFVVETLVVVLFVFAFYRLPRFTRTSATGARLRDLAFAVAMGTMMSLLTLAAAGASLYPAISDYFGEWAYLKAHGRNIVNVILVDFRAVDTFGEITVIAVAAVGVYALLRLRPGGSGP
jgi:multicomponent Na+:H+ antiporter subunit A